MNGMWANDWIRIGDTHTHKRLYLLFTVAINENHRGNTFGSVGSLPAESSHTRQRWTHFNRTTTAFIATIRSVNVSQWHKARTEYADPHPESSSPCRMDGNVHISHRHWHSHARSLALSLFARWRFTMRPSVYCVVVRARSIKYNRTDVFFTTNEIYCSPWLKWRRNVYCVPLWTCVLCVCVRAVHSGAKKNMGSGEIIFSSVPKWRSTSFGMSIGAQGIRL